MSATTRQSLIFSGACSLLATRRKYMSSDVNIDLEINAAIQLSTELLDKVQEQVKD